MSRRRVYVVLPLLLIAAGIVFLVLGGPAPGPAELHGRGARHTVTVRLEPRPGPLEAHIEVHPAAPAEVSVFAVMPHMGHTTPELAAQGAGPGRYVARGELFSMTGVWEISVRVRDTSGTEVIKVTTLVGE